MMSNNRKFQSKLIEFEPKIKLKNYKFQSKLDYFFLIFEIFTLI